MTFSDNEFKEAIMEYAARHGYKITKLALDLLLLYQLVLPFPAYHVLCSAHLPLQLHAHLLCRAWPEVQPFAYPGP